MKKILLLAVLGIAGMASDASACVFGKRMARGGCSSCGTATATQTTTKTVTTTKTETKSETKVMPAKAPVAAVVVAPVVAVAPVVVAAPVVAVTPVRIVATPVRKATGRVFGFVGRTANAVCTGGTCGR